MAANNSFQRTPQKLRFCSAAELKRWPSVIAHNSHKGLSELKVFAILLSAALIYGCAAPQQQKYFTPPSDYVPLDQIRIKPRFDSLLLTKENLASESKKCVPFIQTNTEKMDTDVREFPRNNSTIAVGHASSSKQFIYRGSTGLCLEYSANRYPIYAVETFIGTANPTGVPPDVTDDWYMKIALKIAINGRAKVAYTSGKGTAFLVSYWSDQTGGFALNYWSEFKKAGEWENTEVDYKFSNPALHGLSETKRGDSKKMVKNFPLAAAQ